MKLIGGMLANWGGSTYRSDLLPSHLTPEVKKEFAKNYSVLKEEFYKNTDRDARQGRACPIRAPPMVSTDGTASEVGRLGALVVLRPNQPQVLQ